MSNIIVILDSRIKDIPIVQVAQQSLNRKPGTRIIFTTTQPWDDIKSMGINNNNSKILLKPFRFYELLSLLGNSIWN
jgi:DNA-binding response OmpR family regulator